MEGIIALGYSNGGQQSSVDDYLGQIEAMIGSSLLDDFFNDPFYGFSDNAKASLSNLRASLSEVIASLEEARR